MYQKGDIVLIPFPFTDLSGSKVRPAVVLVSHKKSPDIIVIFITSKPKRVAHSQVSIQPTVQNGLKVPSALLADKIATLDTKVVIGKLGVCHSDTIVALDKELRKLFGLP